VEGSPSKGDNESPDEINRPQVPGKMALDNILNAEPPNYSVNSWF